MANTISKHVELIASGYEFECPLCETLNRIASVPPGMLHDEDERTGSFVTCKNCHADLVVDDYMHAIG